VSGIDSAVTKTASGRVRWKTIVLSSGVSMPEMGCGNLGGVFGAPWMTPKYAAA
jgi:hypothetical protein